MNSVCTVAIDFQDGVNDFDVGVASPQTSFGVRLSRFHFSPTTNEPQRTSAGRLMLALMKVYFSLLYAQ